eukprot:3633016-Rhodomonas_salina.9
MPIPGTQVPGTRVGTRVPIPGLCRGNAAFQPKLIQVGFPPAGFAGGNLKHDRSQCFIDFEFTVAKPSYAAPPERSDSRANNQHIRVHLYPTPIRLLPFSYPSPYPGPPLLPKHLAAL